MVDQKGINGQSPFAGTRNAEEKLRETNEYLDNLFNYANAPIIVWDTQYKITRFNHAFESLTGRAMKDVIGRSIEVLFPPVSTAASMELIRKTTTGERWNVVEIPILNVNGSVRTVLWNSAVVFSPDGKTPIAAIAQGQDITERKEAEEILRDSEEKFKALLDSAPDAFFIYDGKGVFIDGNKAAEKLSGYRRGELIGKSFLKVPLLSADQLIKGIADLAKNAIGIKTEAREYTLNRKDGTKVICEINSTPIKIKNRTYILGVARDLTERKKAERQIKETEERYKTLIESASDQIFMFDEEYKVLSMNSAASKLSGNKPDEMIGKSVSEIFPKEVADKNMENLNKVFKTGQVYSVEEELDFGGHKIYVSSTLNPVKDDSGKTIAVMGVVRDISERKRMEDALREGRQRFENLIETIQDCIWEVDPHGHYTYISPRSNDIFGYEPKELIGKTPFDLMSPEEAKRVAETFGALVAKQKPIIALENTNLHKDGHPVVLETNGLPFYDTDGNIKGYRGSDRDITERKKAERSLKESEEKFKAIFDTANDGFLLASMKDKKFILGNNAICKMTGYTPEEIKSLGVMDLHPEKDLPYVLDQFEKQARKEKEIANDLPVKRKDGSVFYVDVNSSPVTLLGETYLLGVFRDVTERKAAEAMKDELLHKVEEANRNKTEYVSGVSHELRTPLASIKGFVSTIRSDKEMDEATRADFLRIIEEEADRLTRIIEGLLDISRIESGRLKLSTRQFNIIDLITKNIENINPLAASKGIEIQAPHNTAPYIVYADQDKTTQIITNLLSNAIKYNKQGGKISIAASEDDGKVRVDIEDTGIGISKEDLTHMFEKFFRVEGSSSETPGTGLGLAVTKSLVEVMGGDIRVNSKPGEGSRFSFSLPKHAGDKKGKTNERA